jgi:DNA polymerase III delta subunit
MPTPRCHLIVGDDDYRIGLHTKELVDRLVPAAERDLGLEVFDGCIDTCDAATKVIRQATEAIKTQSFFGTGKTVWIRDVTFLGGQRLADAESLKPLIEYLRDTVLSGIPEGHTLILSGAAIAKNNSVALAVGKLAKQGLAEIKTFDPPAKWNSDREAAAFVAEESAKTGRKLAADVCDALVARAGSDPRTLVAELEKLLLYAGEKAASAGDVTAVVTPARSAEAWDLQDAFGARNLPEALSVLRRLGDLGVSPIFLVMQLQTRVNDLLIVRDSLDRKFGTGDRSFQWSDGLPPDTAEAAASLDKRWNPAAKHSFVQGKLLTQCRKFRRLELRKARQVFMNTHERMVSGGSVSPESLLELALTDALAPGA